MGHNNPGALNTIVFDFEKLRMYLADFTVA